MAYVIQVCWQLASRIRMVQSWSCSQAVWHIPLLCVQWKTADDGQRNCPKHVEVDSKNKFEKLLHLVGFIIRIYLDARPLERQIQLYCFRHVSNIHVFIIKKTCTCSFTVFFFSCIHISSPVDVIKLHVQVFLKMNGWMFETCRRHYSWIKSLKKRVCILLVLIAHVLNISTQRFGYNYLFISVINQLDAQYFFVLQ